MPAGVQNALVAMAGIFIISFESEKSTNSRATAFHVERGKEILLSLHAKMTVDTGHETLVNGL